MPLQRPGHNPFTTTRQQAQSRTLRTDFSGDRIFKPGLQGVELWKPDFSAYDTVVRPYPALAEDGSFQPTFTTDGDPTNWYFDLPVISAMGRSYLTAVIDDNSRTVDDLRAQSPVYLLYNAIAKATAMIKRGDRTPESWRGWAMLLERTNGVGGGQSISLPDVVGFFQGAVFRGGKGPYVKDENPTPGGPKGHAMTVNDANGDPPRGGCPDDPAVFFMLPSSARKAFVRELFKGPGVEVTSIGPGEGKFVHIYNQETDPRELHQPEPVRTAGARPVFGASRPGVQRPQQQKKGSGFGKGYDVCLADCLDFFHPDAGQADCLVGNEELVRSKWRNPAEVIWFPTDEELAHLIARLCGPADDEYKGRVMPIPLAALEYAWTGFPSWIPDDVRRIGLRRVQASVPAEVPSGHWQPEADRPGGQAVTTQRSSPFFTRTGRTQTAVPNVAAPPREEPEPQPDVVVEQAKEVFGDAPEPTAVVPVLSSAATASAVPGASPLPPAGQGANQAVDELRRRMAAAEARAKLEQAAKAQREAEMASAPQQ